MGEKYHADIIPILVDDVILPPHLAAQIGNMPSVRINSALTEEDAEGLLANVERRIGFEWARKVK